LFSLILFHTIYFHCTLSLEYQLLYLHKYKMRIFNFFQTQRLKIRRHTKLGMFCTHIFQKIGDYEAAASCIRANTGTAAAVRVQE
jgi:hypothetical protein